MAQYLHIIKKYFNVDKRFDSMSISELLDYVFSIYQISPCFENDNSFNYNKIKSIKTMIELLKEINLYKDIKSFSDFLESLNLRMRFDHYQSIGYIPDNLYDDKNLNLSDQLIDLLFINVTDVWPEAQKELLNRYNNYLLPLWVRNGLKTRFKEWEEKNKLCLKCCFKKSQSQNSMTLEL